MIKRNKIFVLFFLTVSAPGLSAHELFNPPTSPSVHPKLCPISLEEVAKSRPKTADQQELMPEENYLNHLFARAGTFRFTDWPKKDGVSVHKNPKAEFSDYLLYYFVRDELERLYQEEAPEFAQAKKQAPQWWMDKHPDEVTLMIAMGSPLDGKNPLIDSEYLEQLFKSDIPNFLDAEWKNWTSRIQPNHLRNFQSLKNVFHLTGPEAEFLADVHHALFLKLRDEVFSHLRISPNRKTWADEILRRIVRNFIAEKLGRTSRLKDGRPANHRWLIPATADFKIKRELIDQPIE